MQPSALVALSFIANLSIALSANAQPSCWILRDLQGIGYIQDDGYQPQVDRFSEPLILRLNGNQSSVEGSQTPMRQVDEFMATSYAKNDTFTMMETYLIDPTVGVALYTKVLSAKSIFGGMTGAKTFRGSAKRCPR
ncbi:hypothetical protein [Bordetella bronchiseptica]|uniref:hypothetical protein n=1 Tax=Bordetella bronchiseptica TaxID=518 RepID=UPI00081C4608|nr:hypothetical protein [Bordetella bronchiseptica]AOB27392.1 hypothetical protein BBB44_14625 [Bordetella bronchiseptica]